MPANDEQKSPIQVIDRMMRLLDVLAQHPEPLGLKLIAQTGETANLSVRHGDEIVYVERTSSGRSAMRVVHVIGTRAPLHVTAAGKLFLLEEGFARLRDYAKRTGLREHTRNTLSSLTLLER